MHRRMLVTTVVMMVAATTALTGCVAEADGAADTVDTASTAPEQSTETPFTSYWNAMYGVYDDADEIAKRERVESLVADCMAAEGFDYTPVDQHPPKQVTNYMDGYGTAEWAAQHGFGAFPTDEETRQLDTQVASEDPNDDYIASLSDSEAGAYYESLQGPPAGPEYIEGLKNVEPPVYDWQAAGCLGGAQHEVLGDDPTLNERFAPLVAAMNALAQGQLSDPAMEPIDAEWSDCMAADGFADFPTRQSASDAVYAQSDDYWDSGATDEPSEAIRAGWRDYEIEVAVADFACAENVGFDDKALAVQTARENQFIADNSAELEELLAQLAQG